MKPKFDVIYPILTDLIGHDLIAIENDKDNFIMRIYPQSIVRAITILKDHQKCKFCQLVDIVAIDWLDKKEQRFEIVYHLLSHKYNIRMQIRISLDESEIIPSITPAFACANWYEREIWDLFGISFADHPDLRRLLTDYNFVGHPLRKDFNLSGYCEIYYDEKEKRVAYKPLEMEQTYRNFDFLSSWHGNWDDLVDQEKGAYK